MSEASPPVVAGGGRGVAAATPPPDSGEGNRRRVPGLAVSFLAPALLLLAGFVVYPIVYSVVRSLYNNDGGFIGLANYQALFTDGSVFTALKNNVIWVVVAPTLVTLLGLIFAVLTERIKWTTVFKTLVFMPMAVSFLASGVIFRLVYDEDPAKGVLNAVSVSVHDIFTSGASYPGARPGDTEAYTADGDGTFTSNQTVQSGSVTDIGLLAVAPDGVPSDAEPAVSSSDPPADDAINGTVWLDFTFGGGGESNVVDNGEQGLPGITVQALQGGTVVGEATTAPDGTYAISGLPAGSYTVALPGTNFAEPFNGVNWLGPNLITPAIIAAYLWIYSGFAMVLIAAGMSAIPRDALEAARIDGASEWQVFRRVTMPLLAPVLVVVFVTLVINVMKVFDLVFIIAPGSVQPDANVLALEMWKVSFGGGQDQGLGSAIGVFLLLLVIPAMIFNVRRFRSDQQ